MTLSPGSKLSHYSIVETIGQGGMGVVYRALDVSLDRHVALKVLPQEVTADPARLERFQREARALAALNHPGIVTIHSVEEAEGVHFLTMELVEGKTLEEVLRQGGLAPRRYFDIAVALTTALSAAHERGVLHRDLKPGNVMVTGDGRVKILDFGLAKQTRQDQGAESGSTTRTVTRQGQIVGTVSYMAPEQLQGLPADERSDIFSLGIVLYQMATGKRPFQGETWAEATSSILRDTPAPVESVRADLPEHLGRILRRSLEKDPRRRYQTALDLRNEFEDLRAETLSGSRAAGARPRRRSRAAVLAGAVALALLVLVAGTVLWRRSVPMRNVAGAAPAAAAHGYASIAILPFTNMSGDPENEYFGDGITEELINAMVQVPDLNVTARTSVFALKGKNLGVQEIGRMLGVETLLEGSVRRSGDTLRITAQLIKASDGFHLWSERYDRKMADVFAIQDEIAASIVRALRPTLGASAADLVPKARTADVDAYDVYLRGRAQFHRAGRRNWQAARELFLRASRIDPAYALPYTGIADSSSFLYMYAGSAPADLDQADAASLKALDLAPNLAEAHAARGVAMSLRGRYDDANREFETAIRLDPKLFEAYYFFARQRFAQGKPEEAAALYEKAMAARPEDYQAPALLSDVYGALGRTADSKAMRRKTLAIIGPHLEASPDDARALYLGGQCWIQLGEIDRGLEWVAKAAALDPDDPGILYNAACAYAQAGRIDQALASLEKAVDNGFAQKAWIENDSDLTPLRKLPRYEAILKRLK
jgi:non-specific serine/threonine protein kinase